jgi:KDO2-lipid IV(A) lauroyltransferase
MIADQTPAWRYIRYWTTFLNQDTPVLTGTEELARKFDYPVVFMHVDRVKEAIINVIIPLFRFIRSKRKNLKLPKGTSEF